MAATWRVFLPSNADKDVADAREKEEAGQVREAGVDALLDAAVEQGVLTESEMDALTDRLALCSTTEEEVMADLHPKVKFLTSLMLACRHGRVATVRELLLTAEGAAAARAKTERGTTALMMAAEGGFEEAVVALLPACGARGPDEEDRDGNTALLLAASNGSAACVARLLEGRVDPTIRNSKGMAALHAAAKYGHSECLILLLAADNSPSVDTRVEDGSAEKLKEPPSSSADDMMSPRPSFQRSLLPPSPCPPREPALLPRVHTLPLLCHTQ